MKELNLDYIVNEVVKRLQSETENEGIMVEASGRHVHLSRECVELLFGEGYELTKKRDLSQKGQYLCEEKVTLVGKKGTFQNVSVLGPVRKETQVELSKTDALSIGVDAPVRMSGDVEGSGSIIIAGPKAAIMLKKGVIAAKRHIHISPEDAEKYGVRDNEEVSIKIDGERGAILTNVAVRVSPDFNTAVHLDYDEANALSFVKGMRAVIVK